MPFPNELLVKILSALDAPNLVNCRLVSKHCAGVIGHDSHLQYAIELAKARYVDGSPQIRLTVGERLQKLRAHNAAWMRGQFFLS